MTAACKLFYSVYDNSLSIFCSHLNIFRIFVVSIYYRLYEDITKGGILFCIVFLSAIEIYFIQILAMWLNGQ